MAHVIGWYLVGPMQAACAAHAHTPAEARTLTEKWVAAVLPVYAWHHDDGSFVCFVCGERIENS